MYFDIFNYPLTREELFENSAISLPYNHFLSELHSLIEHGLLKEVSGFILSNTGTPADIEKRLTGNAGAKKVMPLAYSYSKKIATFPFVEAVLLSGALSKNYYDEKGDIDFFIVTKPGRLWICRTLLILRFKLLPKNKKKYWCTNYFISSDNVHIPDANVFTGTELAYLIPTVNYTMYLELLDKNNWYKSRFPNKAPYPEENCMNNPRSIFKSFIEWGFKGKIGSWVDNLLLYVTLKHWQRKYPELSVEDFDLQFRSRKNVCKRHTKGFQNKVLGLWENRQKTFELNFNIPLR